MPKFQRVFNPSAVSLCATRRDGTVWARKSNVVVAPVHYYAAMARQEEVRWRYVGFRRPVVWRRRPRLSHTRLATVGPFLVPSLYREKKNRFDSSRTDTAARVSQYTPCTRVQQVGWYTRVLCIRCYGGHRIINIIDNNCLPFRRITFVCTRGTGQYNIVAVAHRSRRVMDNDDDIIYMRL
jgi:hypothetical protein